MDPDLARVIQFALMCGTVLTGLGMIIFAFRGRAAKARPQDLQHIAARLDRIEQAVDTIAIEVERVSEGQRFTSKLLAEKEPNRVPARQITPH